MLQMECRVCGSARTSKVWDLPEFPLTGIYVDKPGARLPLYHHDQGLIVCEDCSHAQVETVIDPEYLYVDTYSHRTSGSSISKSGNEFLRQVLIRELGERQFSQVLEIGCNDLFLLKGLERVAQRRAGTDPIFRSEVTEEIDGIMVRGGFAESVDYSKLVDREIDLVVSAHTFEHIPYPLAVLENLEPFLSRSATFVIEVPSSVTMLRNRRLDQVFSQHVNYYSPESLVRLFRPFRFGLRSITHNFGYWGGTQILVFERDFASNSTIHADGPRFREYELAIKSFHSSLEATRSQLSHPQFSNLAFGAAQMLPILNYHLQLGETGFEAIVDENENRVGKFFPGIDAPIVALDSYEELSSYQVLITAVDSARVLVPKLVGHGSGPILVPLGIV